MMFKKQMAVLCIALLVAGWTGAEDAPRTIKVTGSAEMQVAPDKVVWNISCSDENLSLLAAKESNDQKMKAIMGLVETLNVASDDIQAGSLSISREYDYDKDRRNRTFKHFRVSRHVQITQRDMTRFDEYLEKLVGAAEVEVNLSLQSSKMHDYRWENRLEAMRLAKKKAKAMLEVVGAELGDVLTVDEHPPGGDRRSNVLSNNASILYSTSADSVSGTFAPGSIPVQTTVYVTFEID
jgi:uncharacterized protein